MDADNFVIFHFDGNVVVNGEFDHIYTIKHKNVLSFGYLVGNYSNVLKSKKYISMLPLIRTSDENYYYDVTDYRDYIFSDYLTKHWRNRMPEDKYLGWASYIHKSSLDKKIDLSNQCAYKPCGDKRVGHLINWKH